MTSDDYDHNSRSNLDTILPPSYEHHSSIQDHYRLTKKLAEEQSSEEVTTEMAASLLKLDAKMMAMYRPKENGVLDFVNQKAQEFLRIQRQLPMLDHNTMSSEDEKTLNTKTDQVFKNIALQPLQVK